MSFEVRSLEDGNDSYEIDSDQIKKLVKERLKEPKNYKNFLTYLVTLELALEMLGYQIVMVKDDDDE